MFQIKIIECYMTEQGSYIFLMCFIGKVFVHSDNPLIICFKHKRSLWEVNKNPKIDLSILELHINLLVKTFTQQDKYQYLSYIEHESCLCFKILWLIVFNEENGNFLDFSKILKQKIHIWED